jgi:hypothetical protein
LFDHQSARVVFGRARRDRHSMRIRRELGPLRGRLHQEDLSGRRVGAGTDPGLDSAAILLK